MFNYPAILTLLIGLISVYDGYAQMNSFYHLGTAEGLNDNNVITVERDKNGLVWLGTSEGLNYFDGNNITHFNKHQYPALISNNIRWIDVDYHNRIWLRTRSEHINMLDHNRHIHLIRVGDPKDSTTVTDVLNTKSRGVIVLKRNKHFIWKDTSAYKLEYVKWPVENKIPQNYTLTKKLTDDKFLFYDHKTLVVIDYTNLSVALQLKLEKLSYASAINEDEILAFSNSNNQFYQISISKQKVVKVYEGLRDQHGKTLKGDLRKMVKIDGEIVVITSRFSGLYFLHIKTGKLFNYQHDPINPASIGGNNTLSIVYDSSGYLFVTTQTSGVHYYNVYQPQINVKSYFINESKEIFDGFLKAVLVQNDSIIWLGGQDRLIRWNRAQDLATYLPLATDGQKSLAGRETIRALHMDKSNNLWVGTTRYGIYILNKDLKIIDHIHAASKWPLPSNFINQIYEDGFGNLWIATSKGVSVIKNSKHNNKPINSREIINVHSAASWTVFEAKDKSIWMGTENGVFNYSIDGNENKLKFKNHLFSKNTVYAINQDNAYNLYFGTASGLFKLDGNGSVIKYDRSNGLRNDLCEGILKDKDGFMWIGNMNCIMRYDPQSATFKVFEEGNDFSKAGFRMRCGYQQPNGEMFWGSDKGLVWFDPKDLNKSSIVNKPFIHQLLVNDSINFISRSSRFTFPFTKSYYRFYFSSGDLTGINKTQLRVRLKGFDEQWKMPPIPGQISYDNLPSGEYEFEVEASADGKTWIRPAYTVNVTILPPWWQTHTFRILFLVTLISFFLWLYHQRAKKRKEEELKKVIKYFATSSYDNFTVEDILWDICRNVVYKLNIDDCVIYLANSERTILTQRAAYGHKNPKAEEITNPLQIPFGKGIVGHAAHLGKTIVVGDTSNDDRYIVDSERRYSELAVPIIHENKVIGVIDSEHKKKNFYTKEHLDALESIASICSAKIATALALDAVRRSKLEVMELNVKMAESKFQNLRLQMNPHFLFNSLSSIQHLIVSQQTKKAYTYLTLFSTFLRSLLDYADKDFIRLEEEIKMLKLYIELEALRFDESFTYEIIVDDDLENDEVFVPTLLAQPFVENAIWHGLIHKEGNKKLKIQFSDVNEESILCIIEDNGVGRATSLANKQGAVGSMMHESKGISIVEERLRLLKRKLGSPASLTMEDLVGENNQAIGTRVMLLFPNHNSES